MKKILFIVLLLSLLPFTACYKKIAPIISSGDKTPSPSSESPLKQEISSSANNEADINENESTKPENDNAGPIKQSTEPAADSSKSTAPGSEVKQTAAQNNTTNYNDELFKYMSKAENIQSVGEKAIKLHNGDAHNACVYFVSEALRRVGCNIPVSTANTTTLISDLKAKGFKTSYKLEDLKPGDICFTTDSNGKSGGQPTHTYVFMSWKSKGIAYICDNQIYDYNSFYHERDMKLTYFNNDKNRPKEATAFFMYK